MAKVIGKVKPYTSNESNAGVVVVSFFNTKYKYKVY